MISAQFFFEIGHEIDELLLFNDLLLHYALIALLGRRAVLLRLSHLRCTEGFWSHGSLLYLLNDIFAHSLDVLGHTSKFALPGVNLPWLLDLLLLWFVLSMISSLHNLVYHIEYTDIQTTFFL